jgi:ABC-type Mn2+/Zn2+ transport system permease subunit
MIGKKVAFICIIIIGMIVALPFNYIYGIGGFEVDAVWAIVGIVMIASGVYLLKKQNKSQ